MNEREIWNELEDISGQDKKRNPGPGNRQWAIKLNLFFNRFDIWATSNPTRSLSTDQLSSISLCLHAPLPHPHFYHHWRSHPPFTVHLQWIRWEDKWRGSRPAKPRVLMASALESSRTVQSGGLLNPQPESKARKISFLVENFLCRSVDSSEWSYREHIWLNTSDTSVSG